MTSLQRFLHSLIVRKNYIPTLDLFLTILFFLINSHYMITISYTKSNANDCQHYFFIPNIILTSQSVLLYPEMQIHTYEFGFSQFLLQAIKLHIAAHQSVVKQTVQSLSSPVHPQNHAL